MSVKARLVMCVVTLALVLAPVLAGCTPSSTTPASVSSAATPAPTTGGKVGPSGKLTIAAATPLEALDPHLRRSSYDTRFLMMVFDSLVYRSEKGPLEPRLATAWKAGADGRSWEFTIRQGVKFHNGDPLTSEDIKFSLDRIFEPDLKTSYKANFNNIDRVEAPEPYKLVVYTKQPDAAFIASLDPFFFVVPKKHIEKVGNAAFADNPVGTGPYKFVSHVVKLSWEVTANADYWGGAPAIKDIAWKVVPDEQTRLSMLEVGEVDFVEDLPPVLVARAKATPGIKLVSNQTLNHNSVMMDATKPNSPLAQVKVRQAANYAVDKKAIIDKVLYGQAVQEAGYILEGVTGYDPSLKPYPYDPAKAKQLLAEAGYANGFDTTITVPSDATNKAVGEAIAGFLTDVGIRTKVTTMDMSTLNAKRRAGEAQDMYLMISIDQASDPFPRISLVLYSRKGDRGVYNYYSDPEIDKLMDESVTVFDAAKRQELFQKVFKRNYDEAGYIFLWTTNSVYAMKDKVQWQPQKGWPFIRDLNKAQYSK